MKRLFILMVSVILLIFCMIASANAKTEIFTRDYIYYAGEADSKLSSRVISLEQVKRLLLEELGTFLTGHTEVRDFKLTKDDVVTYTAGAVATIIIEERWNGSEYYVKASIKADPDEVAKSIHDIKKDNDSAEELQQLRAQTNDTLRELDRLKKELAELKKGSSNQDKAKLANVHKEYDQAVAGLSAKEISDKGLVLAKEKKYDEAIQQFTMAMQADPKAIALYGLRGQVYLRTKEYEKAINDFNRVLTVKPNHPLALKNRGQVYYQRKDYALAMNDFEAAAKLVRGDSKLMIDLGRTYHVTKRYEDAINSLTRAIELDPSFAPAYMFRFFSYQALKMNNQARNDLEKAAQLGDPKAKEMVERISRHQR